MSHNNRQQGFFFSLFILIFLLRRCGSFLLLFSSGNICDLPQPACACTNVRASVMCVCVCVLSIDILMQSIQIEIHILPMWYMMGIWVYKSQYNFTCRPSPHILLHRIRYFDSENCWFKRREENTHENMVFIFPKE